MPQNLPTIPSDDDYVTISFDLAIESLDISVVPVTKTTDADESYAVQVYEYSSNTNGYLPYAHGVFDDLSKMNITMQKTKEYKINVGLFYDFFAKYKFGAYNQNTFYTSPNNEFVYNSEWEFEHLCTNISTGYDTFFELSTSKANRSMIECDSYTGIVDNFIPTDENIEVILKRSAFGIKINVDGLKEGRIQWVGRPITSGNLCNTAYEVCSIEYPSTTYEQVFSIAQFMRKLSTDHCYMEFDLYYYDANENKTILNENSINVYRHKKTIINITLSSNSNNENNQSFIITKDDTAETTETIEYNFTI